MEQVKSVTINEAMEEYQRQLQKGVINQAYKALMEYIMSLRTHFQNTYSDCFVSGSLYYGYMDMTYFSYIPESFKHRKLKIAIVFLHQAFQFEVWLAANNKQIQTKYWRLFNESNWDKYKIVPTIIGFDAILEHPIVDHPDFGDLDKLTKQIERETMQFTRAVEVFLNHYDV